MNETRNLESGKQRFATSLKVGVAVAVLSLVALTSEARDMSVPTPMPASASEYFPAHFAAPQGDAEPLPPTF